MTNNVDFAGDSREAPKSVLQEAMDLLAYITMKHGPFTVPSRAQILEELSAMHKAGIAIHKTVTKDKDGKTISNQLFAAPPDQHELRVN